jgi:hypothetical protein
LCADVWPLQAIGFALRVPERPLGIGGIVKVGRVVQWFRSGRRNRNLFPNLMERGGRTQPLDERISRVSQRKQHVSRLYDVRAHTGRFVSGE